MDFKDITVEEFIEMKKKMDEAENDNTPYAVTENDEMSVIGDVNMTETKKHEYVIQFAYPNNELWNRKVEAEEWKVLKTTPNYIGVERRFKDIWVPPRVYTAVQTAFAEIYQFMNVITDDGTLRDLTEDEVREALRTINQPMIESMCHAVATVLRLEPIEEECMLPTSTMAAILLMIDDFPEIINGMDFFSDRLSETEQKAKLTIAK